MKLYRIRRKDTGQFYTSGARMYSNWKNMFTATGVFYRRIDTIKKHLNELMYDHYWDVETYEKNGRRGWYECYLRSSRFDERLNNLEVVVNDVTINGEQIIAAKEIVK